MRRAAGRLAAPQCAIEVTLVRRPLNFVDCELVRRRTHDRPPQAFVRGQTIYAPREKGARDGHVKGVMEIGEGVPTGPSRAGKRS